jgi:hypothetical protein
MENFDRHSVFIQVLIKIKCNDDDFKIRLHIYVIQLFYFNVLHMN